MKNGGSSVQTPEEKLTHIYIYLFFISKHLSGLHSHESDEMLSRVRLHGITRRTDEKRI